MGLNYCLWLFIFTVQYYWVSKREVARLNLSVARLQEYQLRLGFTHVSSKKLNRLLTLFKVSSFIKRPNFLELTLLVKLSLCIAIGFYKIFLFESNLSKYVLFLILLLLQRYVYGQNSVTLTAKIALPFTAKIALRLRPN